MMNYWMIALFVVLRIGIPAAVLLSLGEVLKRRNQYPGNLRGV